MATSAQTQKIDLLNIGLIVVSMVLAYVIPFRLFILGYAILGPLHYLTEISWLDNKQYFVNRKRWVWFVAVFAFLFTCPFLFKLPFFKAWLENDTLNTFVNGLFAWSNGLVLLAIAVAISLVFIKKLWQNIVLFSTAILLSILLYKYRFYDLILGIFLPTIIHVYLFTILFMLFGAMKSKSKVGVIATVLALICPLLIVFIDITPQAYNFPDWVKQTYGSTNFHLLNAQLSKLIGASDGSTYFFYGKSDLKIQIFVAFAYTYHYLNWFSKTSIIGWHKNLTTRRTLVLLLFWLASISLYWYDYKTGFIVLVFLSIMHVFLEFPLNIISIKGIFGWFKE